MHDLVLWTTYCIHRIDEESHLYLVRWSTVSLAKLVVVFIRVPSTINTVLLYCIFIQVQGQDIFQCQSILCTVSQKGTAGVFNSTGRGISELTVFFHTVQYCSTSKSPLAVAGSQMHTFSTSANRPLNAESIEFVRA